MDIVAARPVALAPQPFDKDIGTPALEGAGAFLDALYGRVARQGCFFGDADGGVEKFGVPGPDCGGCKMRETGDSLGWWQCGEWW